MIPTTQPPILGLSDALALVDEEKTELDKVLELLLKPENIGHNTELNRNEILAFSVLSTIGPKYNLDILEQFLKQNLVLRVSKGRQGRKEWVKITSRQLALADQNMNLEQPGRFGRWFRGNK